MQYSPVYAVVHELRRTIRRRGDDRQATGHGLQAGIRKRVVQGGKYKNIRPRIATFHIGALPIPLHQRSDPESRRQPQIRPWTSLADDDQTNVPQPAPTKRGQRLNGGAQAFPMKA
jgi:hypothetical protein